MNPGTRVKSNWSGEIGVVQDSTGIPIPKSSVDPNNQMVKVRWDPVGQPANTTWEEPTAITEVDGNGNPVPGTSAETPTEETTQEPAAPTETAPTSPA